MCYCLKQPKDINLSTLSIWYWIYSWVVVFYHTCITLQAVGVHTCLCFSGFYSCWCMCSLTINDSVEDSVSVLKPTIKAELKDLIKLDKLEEHLWSFRLKLVLNTITAVVPAGGLTFVCSDYLWLSLSPVCVCLWHVCEMQSTFPFTLAKLRILQRVIDYWQVCLNKRILVPWGN